MIFRFPNYRYIAVCHPLAAIYWCTTKKAYIQVAAVVSLAIIINMPRFFQYQFDYNEYGTIIGVNHTNIASKRFWKVYRNIFYNIVAMVLPFSIMVTLGLPIIFKLKKLHRRRSLLARGSPVNLNRDQQNITIVTILIIMVFLVCHTPDRFYQIIKLFVPTCKCYPRYYLYIVGNVMVVVNSSTNFLIYYFARSHFRQHLAALFCQRCSSVSIFQSSTRTSFLMVERATN